ncbi:RbsD or FucU transport [Iocasia frigidifontis]|uniref:RbsD or FucU transport n=1 Tax=Iocasia fonsfrigidae TaxID=2682810 RepID=A0A8A7KED3_9FIRM|nr:RbsD/FucU family protein [Iocasia fonsfrigidae]QTL99620.1 RbsD or FucU transport [Iocasia fonsfrigidae]
MLKTKLIHPRILQALAAAGHGAQVLITDGNYPASTQVKQGVETVYLNLTPGLVKVTDILDVLNKTISIESVTVMEPGEGEEPEIFLEFKECLGSEVGFNKEKRFDFYDQCVENDDLCLVIVSGEQRVYANILLTIGVV